MRESNRYQDKNEREIRPSASKLDKHYSEAISLADLDRLLSFTSNVIKRWKDVLSNIRVGEDSFALTSDVKTVKETIRAAGGENMVEYLSVVLPSQYAINADLTKNQLSLRASTTEMLDVLVQMLRSQENVSPSQELIIPSLIRSAKSFLLSKVKLDGTLNQREDSELELQYGYVAVSLKYLGLENILNSYAEHLIRNQKENGTWSNNLLNTANAVFVLSSAKTNNEDKKLSALNLGVSVLLKRYNKSTGYWISGNIKRDILTAICYLALVNTGKKPEEKTKTNIDKWFSRAKPSTLNPIIVDFLAKRLDTISVFDRIVKYYNTTTLEDLNTIELSLYLLSLIRSHQLRDHQIPSLLAQRIKDDGGWADKSQAGEFITTLFVLYSLDTVIADVGISSSKMVNILEETKERVSQIEKKISELDERDQKTKKL
jgi:hypothetical protein